MTDLDIWQQFWGLTVEGLTLGSIYALIALGYTLVYGVLRLINFANSEVFMLGTFGALWAYGWIGIDPGEAQTGFQLLGALLIAAVVAMACSGATAVFVEAVGYRPLRARHAPRLAFLISAIGMSIAISEGFALWRGRNFESVGEPVGNRVLFEFFDARVTQRNAIIIVSAIVMMVALDQFVARTRFGRGIRAVAQDQETATLMGVNRDRVIQLTFLLGGLMAGVAGVLWAVRYGTTRYSVGFLPGVKAFAAAVLGGIGNLRGALVGGLLLGLVENWGAAIFGSGWKDVIAFVVLVTVLMFRPSGLLGESLGEGKGVSTATNSTTTDTAGARRRRVPGFTVGFDRWPKGVRVAVLVGFVAFLYYLPVWEPPVISTPDIDFGGTLFAMALFCLVAVGLNVVVGEAGLLDLGYIGFFAIGAYTSAVITSEHASLPWLLSLPIAMGATLLAGLVLGTPTLRLRGDYLAIVTLGFGEIIRITAINSEWLGGSAGIKDVARPPSSDWTIPGTDIAPFKFGVVDLRPYYWLTLTMLIVVIVLLRNLERSRVGRAWVAIREDEDAAELMGVPTFRFKLLSFATGAAIGGMAGALFAAKQGFINPQSFPLLNSILFLAAVVLGGAGNLPGVLLGACVIAYLPERFRGFADWRFFVFGVALVVMMIFRPEGLLPNRRRAAEVEARQIDAEGKDTVLDVDV